VNDLVPLTPVDEQSDRRDDDATREKNRQPDDERIAGGAAQSIRPRGEMRCGASHGGVDSPCTR